MKPYYDRNGKPMKRAAWQAAIEGDPDQLQVAFDECGDVRVSTVWTGLDHRGQPGAPLIFETMIFGGSNEGESEWYCTEADARIGHAQVVARVEKLESN